MARLLQVQADASAATSSWPLVGAQAAAPMQCACTDAERKAALNCSKLSVPPSTLPSSRSRSPSVRLVSAPCPASRSAVARESLARRQREEGSGGALQACKRTEWPRYAAPCARSSQQSRRTAAPARSGTAAAPAPRRPVDPRSGYGEAAHSVCTHANKQGHLLSQRRRRQRDGGRGQRPEAARLRPRWPCRACRTGCARRATPLRHHGTHAQPDP